MADQETGSVDLSSLRIQREDAPERPRNTKLKLIVFGLLAGIILILTVVMMTRPGRNANHLNLVEATTVYPTQADALLTASGYVVAQRQAAVASKGTGRLEVLAVEEGDVVKRKQIIGLLEHDDVDASFAQAKANIELAEASLKQVQADLKEAKLNYERQQSLLGRALISQSDFDIAEARFLNAQAKIEAAKAQIEVARAGVVAAEVNVENTRIRAPFDGTVLSKNADIGEMVAPFAASSNSRGAVVTIADMTSLEVEADVSESNIQRVKVGQVCEIVLDAFPNIRYPGYVHKIVPTADRAKATVLTKIRFKERDGKVLPEMSAKVNFLSPGSDNKNQSDAPFVALPAEALTERDGRRVVFVVRENRLSEVAVRVGRNFPGRIEILDGIAAGEKVVLHPGSAIKSGMTVK